MLHGRYYHSSDVKPKGHTRQARVITSLLHDLTIIYDLPVLCQYLDNALFTVLHGIYWHSDTFDVIRFHETNDFNI